MHLRLKSLLKSPKAPTPAPWDNDWVDDSESKTSTIAEDEPLPPALLKIKRLDYFYSRWSKGWKYRKINTNTTDTLPVLPGAPNDQWKDYGIVFVRTIPQQENLPPTFTIIIQCEYLYKVCQDAIPGWSNVLANAVSSHAPGFKPDTFLASLPSLTEYRDKLASKKQRSDLDTHLLSSVNVLLSFLRAEFCSTIATIERLTAQGEITFDLLYTIFLPKTLIVARCSLTGLERLYSLRYWTPTVVDGNPACWLQLEGIDLIKQSESGVAIGRPCTRRIIHYFAGTVPIDSLEAFPLKFHASEAQLRKTILQRGQKWVDLIGVHHMQYNGIAGTFSFGSLFRHQVEGRIMIDSAMAPRSNADSVDIHVKEGETVHLSQEELLLTPTRVCGFSLSDKLWLEFDITKIEPVSWNEDAFASLVLPDEHKSLLCSLVGAHHEKAGFDDFIRGKGAGLVVNLFGPPGVGKTFSAEATSDYVKRPLYVIGAGDLGATAEAVEDALMRAFKLATAWKAIVLIDEVGVRTCSSNAAHFTTCIAIPWSLFCKSLLTCQPRRNTNGSTSLRQVEYYRGILFLTTNRVQAFDEAFLSRIHVALHFTELSEASRAKVWRAFTTKAGLDDISDAQVAMLAQRRINGREIKNAVSTAKSLAFGRCEALGIHHLLETLETMNSFKEQFEQLKVETQFYD
ncbi:AAA domain-containing protein [Mycena venus]|uniref:AAA domain-containing protein n=1 Tax=Mycena venus TaxID=2733690 RepID=A0A8H6YPK4_9AGAR|nr:AAA domain-containing protein [Mycena venus]